MPKKKRDRDHKAEYQRKLQLRKEREAAGKVRKTRKKTAEPKIVHSPINGAAIVAGNPGNSGGKKGRSGRRPDVVKQRAQELLDELELLEEAGDLAKGQVIIAEDPNTGEPIFLPCSAGDRLAAIKFITERAAGKPPQPIVGDEDEPPIRVEDVARAREQLHSRLSGRAPSS